MATEHNYQATTGNTPGAPLEKDFSNGQLVHLAYGLLIGFFLVIENRILLLVADLSLYF
jgi:hypothetical protein